jgi:hypothetical protein
LDTVAIVLCKDLQLSAFEVIFLRQKPIGGEPSEARYEYRADNTS